MSHTTQIAGGPVARRVLAAVEDLLFRSKISETAQAVGVEAAFPRSPKKLLEELRASPPILNRSPSDRSCP